MTNANSQEMRKFVTLLESSDAEVQLDEGFLDNLVTAAKSLFSMGSLGRYEMLTLFNPYEKQFRRAMGQKNQDYATVNYRTLMNFLISRAPLSLKFPKNLRPTSLTRQDVMGILSQRKLRDMTANQIRDAFPDNVPPDFLPTPQTIMSKLEDIISGEETAENQRPFVGKAVVNAYLMAAVMKLLEKSQGGEEFAGEEPAQAAPAGRTTAAPAPAVQAAAGTGADMSQFVKDLTSTLRASGADDRVIDAINQFAIRRNIR